MDPVLLGIKKAGQDSGGGNFYLKISVVLMDGETILAIGIQSILWNKINKEKCYERCCGKYLWIKQNSDTTM